MIGKLVICAVLCVAVSEVCLAQPAQTQKVLNPFQSNLDADFETRITQCRSHLREFVNTVATLVYNFTSLMTEILATVSDTLRCVFRPRELPSCVKGLIVDTFEGMFDAVKFIVMSFMSLIVIILKVAVSCFLPVQYKQFLIAAGIDTFF